jgi:hypothetical protein
MSTGEEAALGRGKRGDDASWVTRILLSRKMKKIHEVDLVASNGR